MAASEPDAGASDVPAAGPAEGHSEDAGSTPTLRRNDDAGRYELSLGGQMVSLADFYQRENVVVIPHTETVPAFGGRGLAGILVGFVLDDIAARGLQVEAACPFVDTYIRRHPEYESLRA
jgi:hypothetical protein